MLKEKRQNRHFIQPVYKVDQKSVQGLLRGKPLEKRAEKPKPPKPVSPNNKITNVVDILNGI